MPDPRHHHKVRRTRDAFHMPDARRQDREEATPGAATSKLKSRPPEWHRNYGKRRKLQTARTKPGREWGLSLHQHHHHQGRIFVESVPLCSLAPRKVNKKGNASRMWDWKSLERTKRAATRPRTVRWR